MERLRLQQDDVHGQALLEVHLPPADDLQRPVLPRLGRHARHPLHRRGEEDGALRAQRLRRAAQRFPGGQGMDAACRSGA